MTEESVFWSGVGPGDAGPYTDDQFSDFIRDLFVMDNTNQGVIPEYLNELQASTPGGVTINVGTGAAIVDGKFYRNDDIVPFTIVAPALLDNYYTFGLDKNFATQEVRLFMSALNTVSPPSLIQTDGVEWQIPLATVRIHHDGTVVITDTRNFIHSPLLRRQGGSASSWITTGANNYIPNISRIQVGSFLTSVAGSVPVTFPVPFSQVPIVLTQPYNGWGFQAIDTVTVTGFNMAYKNMAGVLTAIDVFWIAIGKK